MYLFDMRIMLNNDEELVTDEGAFRVGGEKIFMGAWLFPLLNPLRCGIISPMNYRIYITDGGVPQFMKRCSGEVLL